MLQLPKIERNPKDFEGLCSCRPICKSRRREWKGQIQHTSAELLLERKPPADCFRRWPMKVFPNKPCPLFAKSKQVTVQEKYVDKVAKVVRLCAADIDTVVPTPYLRGIELAKANGALDFVKACCPFCNCGKCCLCGTRCYPMNDPEGESRKQQEMRKFDDRVKKTYQQFRVMYN